MVLCIVKTLSDASADAEEGDHGKACHVVNKHFLKLGLVNVSYFYRVAPEVQKHICFNQYFNIEGTPELCIVNGRFSHLVILIAWQFPMFCFTQTKYRLGETNQICLIKTSFRKDISSYAEKFSPKLFVLYTGCRTSMCDHVL